MQEAMILTGETKYDFMRLVNDFIRENTEYGICALREDVTDSEHVHRISVFVCDKNHDQKDFRWLEELFKYLDEHFPDNEPPENKEKLLDALKKGYGIEGAFPPNDRKPDTSNKA